MSVITKNNFSAFNRNLNYVSLGTEKMIYKASAIQSAQDLMFDGRLWVNLTAEGRTQARREILGNTTLFTDAHVQMFQMVQFPG